MILILSQVMVFKFMVVLYQGSYLTSGRGPFSFHGNCQDMLLNTSYGMFLMLIMEYFVLYVFIVILLLSIP